MTRTEGCCCGALQYRATGDATLKAHRHCRECQYFSGGGPNHFMVFPQDGFSWTDGTPQSFARSDLEAPVTRDFCPECGPHVLTRRPGLPAVIFKADTVDDPTSFGGTKMAIHMVDQQPFQVVPDGLPCFERLPVH